MQYKRLAQKLNAFPVSYFLALAASAPERFVIVDATRSPHEVATAVNTAADRTVGAGEPKAFAARTHQ